MGKLALYTLGFLLIVALVTHLRASSRERAAEAAYPPEGQIIHVNGHPVHAVVRGSGPDLVLIHGASGSTRDWTMSLVPLLEDRYRVIALDRPGFGYTPRLHVKGETLQEQARLLSDAARQIGADKPIVVGQSYGGAVALAWAAYFPDRLSALVTLAAPSNLWSTPLDPLYRITSTRLGGALVVPLLTAWVPQSYVRQVLRSIFEPQMPPDRYADHFGPDMTLRRQTMIANARQRANLLGEIEQMIPHYAQITVPTEILHGTADTIVGLSIHSELLVNQIANASLTPLEGIGHMPQHVAQKQVLNAIERVFQNAQLQ